MHLPGNTLLHGGTYRIIRFISSGGFGCTYEAEHVLLNKRVAIKEFFIKDYCNRDPQTAHVTIGALAKKGLVEKLRRKFLKEAQTLAKMQYPGIVHVFDVFEEKGTAYYVMDYIEGKSLKELIREYGPMQEDKALGYIREVAETLIYLHGCNCLHLDIKPSNIMVDKYDNAILIDFGTSKQYDEENGENTSTLMASTPGYASIEQMSNCVQKFTPATDIYSLGATLYKLLSGITPLDANLLASGEKQLPLPDSISELTVAAVTAAMQLNKNSRPQHVKDFVALLDRETNSVEATVWDQFTEEEKPIEENDYGVTSIDSGNRIRLCVRCVGIILVVTFLCLIVVKKSEIVDDLFFSESTNSNNYVDLGLSVKWSRSNVGATNPEQYGDYFVWEDVEDMCRYTGENRNNLQIILDSIQGNSIYDKPGVRLGKGWRLPTREELQELKDNCVITWTTYKGINGYLLTSKINRETIFLPAAGFRYESSVTGVGQYGNYWISDTFEDENLNTYRLYFDSEYFNGGQSNRLYGFCIRPVFQ